MRVPVVLHIFVCLFLGFCIDPSQLVQTQSFVSLISNVTNQLQTRYSQIELTLAEQTKA